VSATLSYGMVDADPAVLAIDSASSAPFRTPLLTLDAAKNPEGFTATLEVTDSRGVKATTAGKVLWQKEP
jgi:hypothetical protein